MKICGKCGDEKRAADFHVDRSRKDGRHPYCKTCQSKKAAAWCRANRERANANARAYRKRHPKRRADQARAYRDRYPEKIKARMDANVALRRGVIVKPKTCSRCPRARGLQMHHHDYAQPLAVVWLCAPCHANEA